METNGKTVGVVTLGCDKNRVDTERILSSLVAAGYGIADTENADIILINTCAFIESAKREAIDAIFDAAEIKKKTGAAIVVAGCFSERYAQTVAEELPEVDAFVSIGSYPEIVEIFQKLPLKTEFRKTAQTPWFPGRIQTTPPHYAYLKIADGCSNRCTYCAIPMIRGSYRSEPMDKLLEEARALSENGVKELIVVAQDTTRYGEELYGEPKLVELLTELVKLPFRYVRILYAYPERVTDKLLRFIEAEPKMAKYLDIPLQHVNDRILKRMGRKTSNAEIMKLIERVKTLAPSVMLRSTFIVGFPSETEEEFEELKQFIASGKIDYAGFFDYSKEEGTPAEKLPNQIPYRVKRARKKEIELLEQQVVSQKHDAQIGTVTEVFYEGIDMKKGKLYGRFVRCAPDVDVTLYLTAKEPLEVGEIYLANIVKGGFFPEGEVIGRG